MNQKFVVKKGGDSHSVIRLWPSLSSLVSVSLSSSMRSAMEKPMVVTSRIALLWSMRRACEWAVTGVLNATVSS